MTRVGAGRLNIYIYSFRHFFRSVIHVSFLLHVPRFTFFLSLNLSHLHHLFLFIQLVVLTVLWWLQNISFTSSNRWSLTIFFFLFVFIHTFPDFMQWMCLPHKMWCIYYFYRHDCGHFAYTYRIVVYYWNRLNEKSDRSMCSLGSFSRSLTFECTYIKIHQRLLSWLVTTCKSYSIFIYMWTVCKSKFKRTS